MFTEHLIVKSSPGETLCVEEKLGSTCTFIHLCLFLELLVFQTSLCYTQSFREGRTENVRYQCIWVPWGFCGEWTQCIIIVVESFSFPFIENFNPFHWMNLFLLSLSGSNPGQSESHGLGLLCQELHEQNWEGKQPVSSAFTFLILKKINQQRSSVHSLID